MATGDSNEDQEEVKLRLVNAYKTELSASVRSEMIVNDSGLPTDDRKLNPWSNPWLDQFSILLRRGIKERKYESFSTIKIVQVLVVALFTGLLWWQSDSNHLHDQLIGNFEFPTTLLAMNPFYD